MPPTATPPPPRKHVFRGTKSKHEQRKAMSGFDYPVTSLPASGPVTVYYQTSLGEQGKALATQVLLRAPQDYAEVQQSFALDQLPAVNLLICDLGGGGKGGGGAYHYGCAGTDLYCDANFSGNETAALFVAELTEVAEATANNGWDCGASPGEGLSRYLAEAIYPGVLDGYSTAAAWLDGGRPDFVTVSDPTDTNPVSTGCAVLALFWLDSLGIPAPRICQAPGSTVSACLSACGQSAAAFNAAVAAQWPAGKPSGVTTDNPWPQTGGGGGGGNGGGAGGATFPVVLSLPAMQIQAQLTMPPPHALKARIDPAALLPLLVQLLELLLPGLTVSTPASARR
jgi:hypothetical protein